MIWNDTTSGNVTVSYNFADGIWTEQANVLRVRISGASESKTVRLTVGDLVVDYATDNSGHVLIDLTDIVRGKVAGESVSIQVSCDSDSVSVSANVMGLIDPLEMIIPPCTRYEELQDVIVITPPRKWYVPLFGLNDRVETFLNPSAVAYTAGLHYMQGIIQHTEQIAVGSGFVELPADGVGVYLQVDSASTSFTTKYKRENLQCGRRYAAVEWISRAGVTKRHTWEIVKVSDNVIGSTEYQSALGYDVRKGQEVGLTLRMSGLTRYDYWYYSDIITSNDVRVAVSERDADFGDETRVNVVTKKVVQPDASGTYTLDVEIKYKRYDEF